MERRSVAIWMQSALAVAEAGSPARAAKQLGISVTTVYRHLDALDRSLDFQIFDRRHSGWKLRDEASVLLTAGREITRLLRDTENAIRDAAGVGSGRLRIAVSEDFASHYVTGRLHAFCQMGTGVRPEILVSSEFADLSHGEADVAIRPHIDPGDTLVGRRVGRMTHALYASRDYIEKFGSPASLSDLKDHRICGYGAALADYTAAQWLDKTVRSDRIIAQFDSTGAMTQAAVAGLGVGLLPCFVGDALAALKPVLAVDDGLPVDIWLVTAATNRKRPLVRAFFEFFASAIRSDESLFRGVLYSTA